MDNNSNSIQTTVTFAVLCAVCFTSLTGAWEVKKEDSLQWQFTGNLLPNATEYYDVLKRSTTLRAAVRYNSTWTFAITTTFFHPKIADDVTIFCADYICSVSGLAHLNQRFTQFDHELNAQWYPYRKRFYIGIQLGLIPGYIIELNEGVFNDGSTVHPFWGRSPIRKSFTANANPYAGFSLGWRWYPGKHFLIVLEFSANNFMPGKTRVHLSPYPYAGLFLREYQVRPEMLLLEMHQARSPSPGAGMGGFRLMAGIRF